MCRATALRWTMVMQIQFLIIYLVGVILCLLQLLQCTYNACSVNCGIELSYCRPHGGRFCLFFAESMVCDSAFQICRSAWWKVSSVRTGAKYCLGVKLGARRVLTSRSPPAPFPISRSGSHEKARPVRARIAEQATISGRNKIIRSRHDYVHKVQFLYIRTHTIIRNCEYASTRVCEGIYYS